MAPAATGNVRVVAAPVPAAGSLLPAGLPVHAPAVGTVQGVLRAVDVLHLAPHLKVTPAVVDQCDRAATGTSGALIETYLDRLAGGRDQRHDAARLVPGRDALVDEGEDEPPPDV